MAVFEAFMHYLRVERRLSFHTLQAYASDIGQFQEFLLLEYQINDLLQVDHKMVRAWLVSRFNLGEVPKTVNRKRSSLRSFYRYLQDTRMVTSNPVDLSSSLKESMRLPEFVSEVALDRLFEAELFEKSLFGIRDRLIMLALFGMGIRLSELINIKWSDFSTAKQTILVHGKGNKQRIIPLISELYEGLILFQSACHEDSVTNDYMFLTNKQKKLYPQFVYRLVKKYLGLIGYKGKSSPHVLRHTFATAMLNNGADLNTVKTLLGHSSLAATQVYTHNSIEKLKKSYKLAHPRA